MRAFYPESGKLKFVIPSAHHESVTALAICHDDETRPPWRLVTGGQDGRVRVWNVTSSHQVGTVKHREAGAGRDSSGILKTPCELCAWSVYLNLMYPCVLQVMTFSAKDHRGAINAIKVCTRPTYSTHSHVFAVNIRSSMLSHGRGIS